MNVEVGRAHQPHDARLPAPVERGQPDGVRHQQHRGDHQDQGHDDDRVPQAFEQPVELVEDGHLVDHRIDARRSGDRARDDAVVGRRVP